jgi:hypothetical protein
MNNPNHIAPIAPRVAVGNTTMVRNIILMGNVAQNYRDIVYYQYVNLPLEYATIFWALSELKDLKQNEIESLGHIQMINLRNNQDKSFRLL